MFTGLAEGHGEPYGLLKDKINLFVALAPVVFEDPLWQDQEGMSKLETTTFPGLVRAAYYFQLSEIFGTGYNTEKETEMFCTLFRRIGDAIRTNWWRDNPYIYEYPALLHQLRP